MCENTVKRITKPMTLKKMPSHYVSHKKILKCRIRSHTYTFRLFDTIYEHKISTVTSRTVAWASLYVSLLELLLQQPFLKNIKKFKA